MARLKGFKKLTSIDDALSTFLKVLKLKKMKPVKVPIHQALERVLAENIVAKEDLPSSDRSAVDGYAVRAQDTFKASQFSPKFLKLTKKDKIGENDAKQIWTGNPLPLGADAAVMLENTRTIQGEIEVWDSLTPGENISKRGEDIKKGDVAVEAGTRLRSHHLGLLAALGLTHVNVTEKPKVALISTGNELVELGCQPKPDKVTDVNRLILSGMCMELGSEPLDLGIAKDNVKEIGVKIKEGLESANLIVTTGGTSVGYADLVPLTINKIGKPGIVVHGIAMRPGMPTALAMLQGKPIVVLPGNPVAAIVGFEVFARPLILKMLGIESELRPMLKAKLTRRVPSALGRRVFLRVYVFEKEGEFFVDPIRIKGSGILSTMTKANGYVVISENVEGLEEGEDVVVHLFDKVG